MMVSVSVLVWCGLLCAKNHSTSIKQNHVGQWSPMFKGGSMFLGGPVFLSGPVLLGGLCSKVGLRSDSESHT